MLAMTGKVRQENLGDLFEAATFSPPLNLCQSAQSVAIGNAIAPFTAIQKRPPIQFVIQ